MSTPLHLYNTLTRKKEEFKPIKAGQVMMYQCGPTVYWTQHIGNMRAMTMADLIVRSLKYLGYQVTLVRNYTDVGHMTSDADAGEDKMEKGAKRENLSPNQIARKYIQIFEHDIHALNIPDADFKPRATAMIPEIINIAQTLLDKGFAYITDLAVYLDISKVKDYTKLSNQKLDDLMTGAGSAEISDPQKKNPIDCALWIFKAGTHKNALQTWPSPFKSNSVPDGVGFPGWHIECSAMAKKYLADTIDIHMGGLEHIPIHHTNEIAQSESANGVPLAHYWLHNGHLVVNQEKMAKSKGTSYSLQEIIAKGFNPLVLRYFFLQAHYRSQQNFTWEALTAAQNGLNNLYSTINYQLSTINKKGEIDNEFQNKFLIAINDDLNIPQALALAHDLLKSSLAPEIKLATLLDFDRVFGLDLDKIETPATTIIPAAIKKLADEREQARQNKDYKKADELRQQIEASGFTIEDTANSCNIIPK